MIKNGDDINGPQSDIFGDQMPEDNDLEVGYDEEDPDDFGCEVYHAVMNAIFLSRPLGILWDDDLIEDFLKSKNYRIVERVDEDGEVYSVPVKPGEKMISERRDSLRRVFDREIQETLIKWLKKIK